METPGFKSGLAKGDTLTKVRGKEKTKVPLLTSLPPSRTNRMQQPWCSGGSTPLSAVTPCPWQTRGKTALLLAWKRFTSLTTQFHKHFIKLSIQSPA